MLFSLLTSPDPEHLKEPCYRQVVVTLEGVVAATQFTPDRDILQRRIVHNHTLLIQEDDYRRLGGHPQVFEQGFTKSTPQTLQTLNLYSTPRDLQDDLQFLRGKLGKQLSDVLRTVANHNLDKNVLADIGVRGNAQDRLHLVYALLNLLPPNLRVVSWTTENAPTLNSNGLVVHENWRTIVDASPTGFFDLEGLSESLPQIHHLHQKYEALFNELTPYEWGIYTRVLNQLIGQTVNTLTPLAKLREDRRAFIKQRLFDDLKERVLNT